CRRCRHTAAARHASHLGRADTCRGRRRHTAAARHASHLGRADTCRGRCRHTAAAALLGRPHGSRAALFWRNLYLDYKEVAVETLTKSREKPKNAVLTLAGVAGALYCCSANPDERSYRDAVQASSQELALVGAPIRNPATCRHLHRANTCLDKGEVRRLGLGLLCLVWADTRDAGLGVYAAQCPHLRPHPRDWPRLLLDVGFLDRWWLLRRAMHDCDVNPAG
ncbi:mitochondrial import inner membrane translocase subunit Tim29-like, partial [Bacillus rossius redtenbacheri]|uniref:mitochondrial import inner membrane translocase subunit Tim29-like n=1 Tax=Bacillus rossius redtenbacheri TaxID=93214 RepID=UPI002FDC8AA7